VILAERSGVVGIIANHASGRDIRRLVAQATAISNQDKIAIVRRVIVGLGGAGVARVLMMPDPHGMASRAARPPRDTALGLPEIAWVDMEPEGAAEDSRLAAAQMAAEPVGCIVVLGGDGTVRAISQAVADVPILALSTGTNNVLPTFLEPTVAGLAAGAVSRGRVALSAVAYRHKWLEVLVDQDPVDRALVDVALLRGRFVGARAIWDAGRLWALFVTRADPATIGVSAIAGMLQPISPQEARGLAVWLAPEAPRQVVAALGPGLLAQLGASEVRELAIGQDVRLSITEPTIVALDGERELALTEGQLLTVRLCAGGPWIVDGARVLREIALLQSENDSFHRMRGEAP
jgi:predicted polyphosphate/ATP-dependent NAD kinase